MTKTIVIHSVILDALKLLSRKHKYPPRGWTAPVKRAVKGHPATDNSAMLWEGAEARETSRRVSDVYRQRGFPLLTKNIRSNLNQQRQRNREVQEQRERNHHRDSLKI